MIFSQNGFNWTRENWAIFRTLRLVPVRSHIIEIKLFSADDFAEIVYIEMESKKLEVQEKGNDKRLVIIFYWRWTNQ